MISLNDMSLENIGLVGLNNVTMQSLESVAGVVAGGSGYVAPVVEDDDEVVATQADSPTDDTEEDDEPVDGE